MPYLGLDFLTTNGFNDFSPVFAGKCWVCVLKIANDWILPSDSPFRIFLISHLLLHRLCNGYSH